uniref:Protein MIX23 n=1 Tax=Acrobeloides nanus TaxID=290746 RepID=A0A914C2D5_9BILA
MEDKIIFELNCRLPTNSFASQQNINDICKDIKTKLGGVRKQRADLLQKCIKENQAVIANVHDDPTRADEIRSAHTNIRLLRNENTIEEITVAQADQTIYERCRKAELLS